MIQTPATLGFSAAQGVALGYLEDNETTEIFYGGGAGGGKSYVGSYAHIKRRLQFRQTRGALCRLRIGSVKDSTLVTLFEVADTMKLRPNVHYKYNDNKGIIKWYNGSTSHCKELFFYPRDPNYNSLGSTPYTDAFVDEAPECPEHGVNILSSRLRWKIAEYGIKPKLLLTGNPGDSWLKFKYVKDRVGNMINLPDHAKRVLATLRNNPNAEFRRTYEQQLRQSLNSEYDLKRLLDGDWDAQPRTGKEYYHTYDSKHHKQQVLFRPDLAVHIGFDFNMSPYMTLLCCQMEWNTTLGVWDVWFWREFCYENPLNTTYAVAESLAEELRGYGYKGQVFYYGDWNGKTGNTLGGRDDYRHNYAVVEDRLAAWMTNTSDRVITNKSIMKRRDFMLDIHAGKLPIRVHYDYNMIMTTNELAYMKEGRDGKKNVELTIDPITHASYEKRGHTSDTLEYIFTSVFDDYFSRYC